MTILHRLLEHVVTHGDDTAYVFLENGEQESDRRTFAELLTRAQSVATSLREAGLSQGDRALLLFPPGLDFLDSFLGCLLAGVVAVPAYPPRANHSLQRLQEIVKDCAASAILTTDTVIRQAEARRNEDPVLSRLSWLAGDSLSVAHLYREAAVLPSPEQLAFLQYTSGSTGNPKGVMVTHRNLVSNEEGIMIAMGYRGWTGKSGSQLTIFVSWLPLFHDMGLIGNAFQPLFLGILSVIMPPVAFLQHPLRWLHAVTRYGGTAIGAPNFGYDLCAQKATPEECAGLDLRSLEVVYNGSEPVRAHTLERFYQTFAPYGLRREALYPCYGMAEATLMISGVSATDAPRTTEMEDRDLVSCGTSIIGHEVRIIDPETGQHCPTRHIGEIWFRGASVAAGYWNKPELTLETFHAYTKDTNEGPFLRTGDLGFLDERGELFVTGRLKDLIIIRGRNHYPHDIERTAEEAHPALRSAGAAAFTIEMNGTEQLAVVVEVEREHVRHLDSNSVKGTIREAIAHNHELFAHTIVLIKPGALPKTSSGKVQRRACRAALEEGTLSRVDLPPTGKEDL